jgi:hypothetical protein
METHVHERPGPHTCPFCHDALSGATWQCDGCGTLQHEECARDNRGCTSLGCVQRYVPRPASVEVPRPAPVEVAPAPPALPREESTLLRNVGIALVILSLPLVIAAYAPGVAVAVLNTLSRGSHPVQKSEVFQFILDLYGIVFVASVVAIPLAYLRGRSRN